LEREENAMSVMLNLDPDVEKSLAAQAQARGISLGDYLQEIAVREAARLPTKAGSTGEERAKAFLEWVESFPDTPPLSDEAISRASMYPDR
jgi:hypothetical protein